MIAFGFGILLTAALLIGLIVGTITLVGRSGRSGFPEEQRSGPSLRRFLQYSFLLIALFTAASGVSGLVELAFATGAPLAGRPATQLALALSLSLVAVPVHAVLWRITRRTLGRDAEERASLAWALCLAVASTVAMVVALVALVRVGYWAVGAEDFHAASAARALVWGAVWVLHTRVLANPRVAPTGAMADLTVLAGATVALVTLAAAAAGLLALGFGEVYETVAARTLVAADPWRAARLWLVPGVLAAGLWWWHWLREAAAGPRTTLWHAAVILVPILGGLLLLVVSSAAILDAVLQWLVGVPDSARAAVHFAFVPDALSAGLVGAWTWAYHRAVLRSAPERHRTEPERASEYLAAAVSLVAAASGLGVAIVALLEALSPAPLAAADLAGRSTLVTAVTLLIVGGPLWWVFWRRLAQPGDLDETAERRSPSRRAYLFLLCGGAGFSAMVSVVVILFTVLRDLFEGTLSSAVIADVRTAVALLITAGGVSAYHWTVYREDRAERGATEPAAERFVLLLAPDPVMLGGRLQQDAHVTVQALRRLDDASGDADAETAPHADPDAVTRAVLACPYPRMLVVVNAQGAVRVVPYETLRP